MAKDFLSDAEMGALEKAGKAKGAEHFKQSDFISDADMTGLEKSGVVKVGASSKGILSKENIESFTRNASDAATLGYMPQIQGLVGSMLPSPTKDVDAKLRAEGFSIDHAPSDYVALRDKYAKETKEISSKAPVAGVLGQVAGSFLPGVGLAGRLPQASTSLLRIGQAAATGGGLGLVANPGDVEGEINPTQAGARLKNAGIGAATGAVVQGGIEGIGKAGKGISEWLKGKAEQKASAALGRQTPTQALQMEKSGQTQEIGRTLLDENAIPILGTPKRIAGRVEQLKEKAGEQVGALIRSAGDKKVIDGERMALELLDSPEVAQMRKTPGMEGFAEKIEKFADTLAGNGEMSLSQAQKLRQGIDKSINFNKRASDMPGIQGALYDIRTALRDKMDNAIAELQIAEKGALKAANRKYGNLAQAEQILEKELGRQNVNRAVSLTDTIAAAGGAATGSPLAALALGALNKAGRTFGNSVMARGGDAASKALANVPAAVNLSNSAPQVYQGLLNRMANPTGFTERGVDPILNNPQVLDIFEKNPGLIDNIKDDKLKAELNKRFSPKPAKKNGQ